MAIGLWSDGAISLLPVLLDRQPMLPGAHLPESLRPITEINACVIEDGGAFHQQADRLIASIESLLAKKWILVVGSGGYSALSRDIETVSEVLGVALADSGYGLITGGWPGVDHITAEAFVRQLSASGKPPRDYLLQILPASKEPAYKFGRIEYTDSEEEAWGLPVTCASAIVVIGGEGGARVTAEMGEKRRVPVFPLPSTSTEAHPDAQILFDRMLASKHAQDSAEDFRRLQGDSGDVIIALMQLIRKALAGESAVQHFQTATHNKDRCPLCSRLRPSRTLQE